MLGLRFVSEQEQMEFLHELQQQLDASDFDEARKMCADDPRACRSSPWP